MTALALTRRRRLMGGVAVGAMAVSAAAFGFAIALVASLFGSAGPAVMLALPLLPVFAVAVFLDPRIGLVGAIALAPVGTLQIRGLPMDLIHMVIAGVAVLVGLRLLATGRSSLTVPKPLWWLVGLLGWSLLALPSSLDQAVAVRAVGALAVELAAAVIVVVACRSIRDVRLVLGTVVAVAFVASLQAPADARNVAPVFGGAVVEGRASAFFTQPNQLGSFCMLAGLLAVGLALSARTRRARVLGYGVAATITVGLLLSFSRGSWIGFSAGVLVLLAMLPEARRMLALVSVPLVLLAFVLGAFASSNPQVEVVGQRLKSITGERNPYDNRPAIWAEARREIVADPLTGEGPGNFPVASERATSESRSTFAFHAHNLLLTWAAEAGLPAALMIVGFSAHVGVLVHRVGRRARREGRPQTAQLLGGLAAAGVAVMSQGIIDYTLRHSVIYTAVFVVVACLLVTLELESNDERDLFGGRRHAAAA